MWHASGGAASVYEPGPTSFKVNILWASSPQFTKIDVKKITDDYRWYVNWIGIEDIEEEN
jgi:hypothetical protein